jgi:16S rRNA pseudouridine516 synthase
MMRLDKFLADSGSFTRSEAGRAIRSGRVTVDGLKTTDPSLKIDETRVSISCDGTEMSYVRFRYFMLNKPDGYVSATEDGRDPVVTELLPAEYRKMGVFPCGRLDKHTLGLMLITNDGALSHRLLAPKSHVSKSYAFRVKFPLSTEDVAALEAGVDIGGYVTKPCRVSLVSDKEGIITITEGKYHQIKLMMEAVHNQITYLERRTFGPLVLDEALERGEWRPLTAEEETALAQI